MNTVNIDHNPGTQHYICFPAFGPSHDVTLGALLYEDIFSV